jgi:hypothetical protein
LSFIDISDASFGSTRVAFRTLFESTRTKFSRNSVMIADNAKVRYVI